MEAKINQDAPDSSLQVRTLCGQARSFHGHLAACENAVWQPAPAIVRADVYTCIRKHTGQQRFTAHTSSQQYNMKLKLKLRTGQVSWQHHCQETWFW